MEVSRVGDAADQNIDPPMRKHALQTSMDSMSNGERLDLVNRQRVRRLERELHHARCSASALHLFPAGRDIQQIDLWKKVRLTAGE